MCTTKRTKSLLFKSWELFRTWYNTMRQRFSTLRLSYMKFSPGHNPVRVVITY